MGRWELKFLVVCLIGLRIRALTDVWRRISNSEKLRFMRQELAAADVEDLVALQFEVAAIGLWPASPQGATRMLKVSRAGRWLGVEFNFHDT